MDDHVENNLRRCIRSDTHMLHGPGDPGVQQEREPAVVEPARGLDSDEDVLQPQWLPVLRPLARILRTVLTAHLHTQEHGEDTRGHQDQRETATKPPHDLPMIRNHYSHIVRGRRTWSPGCLKALQDQNI